MVNIIEIGAFKRFIEHEENSVSEETTVEMFRYGLIVGRNR